MATQSRRPTRNQSRFDVLGFVQERGPAVNEWGDTINDKDRPLLECWAEIRDLERDGSKEITAGEEINVTVYEVSTLFDEELYEALRASRSVFMFDGNVCEISNIILIPSFGRAREIKFRAMHGKQDFSKNPL